MQAAEQTYLEIVKLGAQIINKNLRANSAYTVRSGGNYAVAIDEQYFGSQAELNTALIHEYAHVKTKMLYSERASGRTRDYCEAKVLRYIARSIITKELVKQIARGHVTDSIFEVAEVLCVMPSFLVEIISVFE